jgi:hypothetical protein
MAFRVKAPTAVRPDDDGGRTSRGRSSEGIRSRPSPEESTLTASFSPSQPVQRRSPSAASALVIGIIAGVGTLVLATAGVTFLGLAIAFPIAVPVAAAYHLPVSAADAALAERFAAFWPAFAALSIASFVAAGVVVVKAIGVLSPGPRD